MKIQQLAQTSAELGLGFRGRRTNLGPVERKEAAQELIRLYRQYGAKDVAIPSHLWGLAELEAREVLARTRIYHSILDELCSRCSAPR